MSFLQSWFKNSMQHVFLTKFCEHLSRAHLAPDSRPAASRTPTDVLCPEKGRLPVACHEREERWSHQLRGAGVFLAAISCQLPLNGLQMVRERLLGTARGPVSSALWGRIYNRMAVYAYPEQAWRPRPCWENQLPVGMGSVGGGDGQEGGQFTCMWHLSSSGVSSCYMSKGVGLLCRRQHRGIRYWANVLVVSCSLGKKNKSSCLFKVR